MNIKRIIGLGLALVVLVTALTGCDIINQFIGGQTGGPQGSGSAGKNTLIMEAEYINIDNVAGAGISNNNSGLSMIYGDGTDGSMTIEEASKLAGTNKNDIIARIPARPAREYVRG